MTRAEALAEAQRRWGPTAEVVVGTERKHGPNRFYVRGAWTEKLGDGTNRIIPFEERPWGNGDSWEAAFADADQKAGAR